MQIHRLASRAYKLITLKSWECENLRLRPEKKTFLVRRTMGPCLADCFALVALLAASTAGAKNWRYFSLLVKLKLY